MLTGNVHVKLILCATLNFSTQSINIFKIHDDLDQATWVQVFDKTGEEAVLWAVQSHKAGVKLSFVRKNNIAGDVNQPNISLSLLTQPQKPVLELIQASTVKSQVQRAREFILGSDK